MGHPQQWEFNTRMNQARHTINAEFVHTVTYPGLEQARIAVEAAQRDLAAAEADGIDTETLLRAAEAAAFAARCLDQASKATAAQAAVFGFSAREAGRRIHASGPTVTRYLDGRGDAPPIADADSWWIAERGDDEFPDVADANDDEEKTEGSAVELSDAGD